jgi:hypothetical protein
MIVRHSVSDLEFARFASDHRSCGEGGLAERDLAHLVRSLDPEQREARGKDCDDPLHKREPRRSYLWIILDNEA